LAGGVVLRVMLVAPSDTVQQMIEG
jgi:hypothetical protein